MPCETRAGFQVRVPLWPTILIFATSWAISVFTKFVPYLGDYALGSVAWSGRILMAFGLGSMLSQPVWAALSGVPAVRHC